MGLSGASETAPEKPTDKKITNAPFAVLDEHETAGPIAQFRPLHARPSNSPSYPQALRSAAAENIRDKTPDALA
jgi:hypothetical protein